MTDEEKEKLFEILYILIQDMQSINKINQALAKNLLKQLTNPEPKDY